MPEDYRTSKNITPALLNNVCAGYPHLQKLQQKAAEGVKVQFTEPPPVQPTCPSNHGSARARLNFLRKNIRTEQDAWRLFSVVDESGGDSNVLGRTFHVLSSLEDSSINDQMDQDCIERPEYVHCDAIAAEILRVSETNSDTEVGLMAWDMASAFRHISFHCSNVHWLAGMIDEASALIIELGASFGLANSPGSYETVVSAVP
ncbi:hypothetical protein ON010_g15566 [Phytophthora cinnamomi]|nr:hypothetical protein ON010_g15566 [Phytophthora cinnamomi]